MVGVFTGYHPAPTNQQKQLTLKHNMDTQRYPATPQDGEQLRDKMTKRVTVRYQAGVLLVDDAGYDVVDSVEDEAVLPAYRMATHLEGHIAKAHPGLDLVDWIVRG